MSQIPASNETETESRVLHVREWGWNVELKKGPNGVCLEVSTDKQKGYAFNVDSQGNVTEYIEGDFCRVVLGCVIEKTGESHMVDVGNAAIMRSHHNYVALVAPEVHLNPAELQGPITDAIPAQLKKEKPRIRIRAVGHPV